MILTNFIFINFNIYLKILLYYQINIFINIYNYNKKHRILKNINTGI